MATSLHDGGSRADFNRQQKTSKDSEMTLITYLKQYNPEFLRQAILTLANPSIRPNPEAEISEFISVYRDVQNDDVFRTAVSTYISPERNSFKSTQKATPKDFPRLNCLAVQLGVLGALDATFEFLDFDQPATADIEKDSIRLCAHIVDLISEQGQEEISRNILVGIFQTAYDLFLTGDEETGYTYVLETIQENFGAAEADEEGDEEGDELDTDSESFAEEDEDEDEEDDGDEEDGTEVELAGETLSDAEYTTLQEQILTTMSDIRELSEESLGMISVGGIPIKLDSLDAEVLPLYSSGALDAILAKLELIIDSLHDDEEDEGIYDDEEEDELIEFMSEHGTNDAKMSPTLESLLPEFSIEDQIKNPTQLGLLNSVVAVTPEIKFALNVVVEAVPMGFTTDIAEVKTQLANCDRYTDEPINFWNTLKSSSSDSGYRGFAHTAISNIMDYLNAVANTPIQVIADISKKQVLESMAHSMQSVVNTLVYDFDGVSLLDIAIPVEPEEQVLEALDGMEIEDATGEDFEDLGIEYVNINDLVYVSVYVAEGDTIVTRVHINIPPLARVKVRSAITKVFQNLTKLLDNSNVETTLGFAYNSVNVFEDLDAADSVRDMTEQGFELFTRSQIEDSVLFEDSVLPETLTPVSAELVSGMFPYTSDWLVLAMLSK